MGIAAAAGIGALGGLYSSRKAGKSAEKTSARAGAESGRQFDASMEQMKEAAAYLEEQGVPPEEAQHLALQYAQLGPSAMEDVETDPRLRSAQMDALARIQSMGEAGLTEEEKAQQMMSMRSAASGAQARDKAILQSMEERGVGGSGAELIARLQGSQSAADRASMAQAQLSGQAQNRALRAMTQAGALGGQIRGQEYGEQTNLASARDRIAQFNEQNRIAAANEQERARAAASQRAFENQMAKRQAVASAKTGTAQAGMSRAGETLRAGQAKAEGQLAQGAAKAKLYGALGTAGVQAFSGASRTPSAPATAPATAPTPAAAEEDDYSGYGQEYAMGGVVGTPEYSERQEYAVGGVVEANIDAPSNNGGFADGGIPAQESGMSEDDRYLHGDIVPGESFEGDRVDAKVNSGEMVLNIEQQQRLMELLKGLRGVEDLGDEDIVVDAGESFHEDPEFADGGMVPSEYKTPTDAKPRGLHASLRYEQAEEEKSNVASKERKARMKALDVLRNGGK